MDFTLPERVIYEPELLELSPIDLEDLLACEDYGMGNISLIYTESDAAEYGGVQIKTSIFQDVSNDLASLVKNLVKMKMTIMIPE
ncbi:MAG: hypothetical protein LUF90_01270 [Rikenellaceae bacterium]|nr:hypothetical protein [Rikenellaceae bacterium]